MRKLFILISIAVIAATVSCAPPRNQTINDLPIGAHVFIKEDNNDANFIVVEKDTATKSATLLRDEPLPEWRRLSEYSSYYPESEIDAYLENDYLDSLSVKDRVIDAQIAVASKDSIGTVGDNTEEITRKVYLLACSEIGFDAGYAIPDEGAALGFFKANPETSRSTPNHETWLLRTPNTTYDSAVYALDSNEQLSYVNASDKRGVRPAICIDGTTRIHNAEGSDAYYVQ